MITVSVGRAIAVLRFITLFVVYVAALSVMGIVRAGQMSYRRTIGRLFGGSAGPTSDEPGRAPRSRNRSAVDGDGTEEAARSSTR